MSDDDADSQLLRVEDGPLALRTPVDNRILSEMVGASLVLAKMSIFPSQRGFPPEKRDMANQLAEALLDEGVNTPEALAKWIDANIGERARPFSQALWNQLASVDPSLTGVHDWQAVYSSIVQASEHSAVPAPQSQATTYTNANGDSYTIRPSNSAPGGQAADYRPGGSNPPATKINFSAAGAGAAASAAAALTPKQNSAGSGNCK